ncbi:CPBP family intramembrane glutamic endopeptidase [Streptomyces rimosus]|uniref:CPBP family intramembrane glutamic endopeptidase n=1 Tax=Streptomyces rimosus TaxID=1927 RepID=UPI00067C7A74|nr:type II CAAX endopeptidase family protein [Streptomyces rimosus]
MTRAGAITRTPATGRSPLAFVTLLTVLSVPFWLAGAVFDRTGSLPMGMPVAAFQFVLPAAVAAFLVFREEGGGGVRRLMKRTVSGGGAARRTWWVIAVLLVPALLLMTYGLMALAGEPPSGPHSPLASIPLLLILYFFAALAEEAGWTGYLLRPVRERYGALGAGLVIGLIWAAWHLVAYVQAGRSVPWIVGQVLASVAVRVLMVWLVANTGGAVLIAVVVHTTINLAQSLFPGYPEQAAPALVYGLLAALTAAAVVLGVGPRTLTRTKPL